jgi:hypothetical protein
MKPLLVVDLAILRVIEHMEVVDLSQPNGVRALENSAA